MRTLLLLLATTSILSAQYQYGYIQKTGRDSYTVTIPDNDMPRDNYTPRMERNARRAMSDFGYDYGALDEKYPVREVIPRGMLPSGAQKQLEEEDIRMRTAKINEDRANLDLERDRIALKTIDATNEQERIGLERLRQIAPGSADYETQVATIINDLPFAASGKAFNEAMNVLNTAHSRKMQSSEIIERGKMARDEQNDYILRSTAIREAQGVGDPRLVASIAQAKSGEEAMQMLTAATGGLEYQSYINALTDAGVGQKDQREWDRFFVMPDQQIAPDAKPVFNRQAAELYLKQKQTEEKTDYSQTARDYDAAERAYNRMAARKERGLNWTTDDDAKLDEMGRVLDDLATKRFATPTATPQPAPTGPQPMPTPAPSSARSGVAAIPVPKDDQEKASLRSEAQAAISQLQSRGATPSQIEEAKQKINQSLNSVGVPSI